MRSCLRWPSPWSAVVFSALVLGTPIARADEREESEEPRPPRDAGPDGAYGRLDGDVMARAGLGAAVASGGPVGTLGVGALYLHTAGLYARYDEGFGNDDAASARTIATGVELRPLFLARFLQNWEQGPAWLDLFVDSFSLSLGTFFHAPHEQLRSTPGFEVGLGLDVPLGTDASGLFLELRGGLRLPAEELARKTSLGWLEQGSNVCLMLAWHDMWEVGIVDARDGRLE